jgi:hypothetical protein
MEFRIYDADGEWYVNKGVFPLVDGTDNTTRFEPGMPVQVTVTRWLAGQSALVKTESPVKKKAPPASTK